MIGKFENLAIRCGKVQYGVGKYEVGNYKVGLNEIERMKLERSQSSWMIVPIDFPTSFGTSHPASKHFS